MNKQRQSIILIILAGIAWSFGGVLNKFTDWNAFTLAGIRSVIAILMLGLARGSFRIVNNRATWIGAAGVACTSLLFMVSNKLTSAANAIVLQYAMPVFVMAYQMIVQRRRPPKREAAAIGVVLIGVILCFCQGFTSGGMLGNALALLSAVSWAAVFLAARMPGCDTLAYTYQGNLLGCLMLVALPFDHAVSLELVPCLTALGLGLALGFGYLFFSLGMKKGLSSVTAAIIANVEPVLNPTWCFLLLGENPGILSVIGAAIVLLAVTAYSIVCSRPQDA